MKGAVGFPGTYHIAGDNHSKGCERTKDNVNAMAKVGGASNMLPMDVMQWDVTRLPLKTSSVDVIVTDLAS